MCKKAGGPFKGLERHWHVCAYSVPKVLVLFVVFILIRTDRHISPHRNLLGSKEEMYVY